MKIVILLIQIAAGSPPHERRFKWAEAAAEAAASPEEVSPAEAAEAI